MMDNEQGDPTVNKNSTHNMPKLYLGDSFNNEPGTNNLIIPVKFTAIIDKYNDDIVQKVDGESNKIYFTDILNGLGALTIGICIRKKKFTYNSQMFLESNNACECYVIQPGFACYFIRNLANNFMDTVVSYIMTNHMVLLSSFQKLSMKSTLVKTEQYTRNDTYSNLIMDQLEQNESLPILVCGFEEDYAKDFVTRLGLDIVQNYWLKYKKFITLWNNLNLTTDDLNMKKMVSDGVSKINPSVLIIQDIEKAYQAAIKSKITDKSMARNKQSLCNTLDAFSDREGLITLYISNKSFTELEQMGTIQDKNGCTSVKSFYRPGRVKMRIEKIYDRIIFTLMNFGEKETIVGSYDDLYDINTKTWSEVDPRVYENHDNTKTYIYSSDENLE